MRFLHIYIKTPIAISQEDVEKKLSYALDWYRYDQGIYVVYTSADVNKWQSRLLEFAKGGGRLFICELKITSRAGWMNKEFWEWLKKPRNKLTLKTKKKS